jgi:hypothetical protein
VDDTRRVGDLDRQAVIEDYQELLSRGYLVRRYSDVPGWMSALGTKARADCLHIEMGVSPLNATIGWGLLRRAAMADRMAETARIMLLRELAIETARDQDTELDPQRD